MDKHLTKMWFEMYLLLYKNEMWSEKYQLLSWSQSVKNRFVTVFDVSIDM